MEVDHLVLVTLVAGSGQWIWLLKCGMEKSVLT
jgi:hypothetical protein